MKIAQYGVLSHFPHLNRTEHVHIGIVTFMQEGLVRVHFGDDLKKLKAIDPTIRLDVVRSWEEGLPRLLSGLETEKATAFLKNFGNWHLSSQLGKFSYQDEEEYLARVTAALANLVSTTGKAYREKSERSKLHLDLKNVFQRKGWLGKDVKKTIVEKYPLGPMTTAEFAVRNGVLHVIETLDLRRSNPWQRRSDARNKALAFDMARRVEQNSSRYAVLAGINNALYKDAKALFNDYCQHVINWDSGSEMDDLLDVLGKATGKPGMKLPAQGQ